MRRPSVWTQAPALVAALPLVPVILLWALNPLVVPELARSLPVPEISFLAMGAAMVVIALAITVAGKWRAFGSWGARDWAGALALGAVGIFPYSTLYYLAFSLAPEAAGAINIVNYLWPIWTVVLSALILGERLGWRAALGLLLSFTGVYVIASGGRFVALDRKALPAYVAAGSGALFWGLFSALAKRRRQDPLCSMLAYDIGACLCFGSLALALGGIRAPSPANWGRIALIGGGSNGIAYLLWMAALRRGETARVSGSAYLVPFVSLVYLRVFRGAPMTAVHFVALALVVAGPLVQLVGRGARRAERGDS